MAAVTVDPADGVMPPKPTHRKLTALMQF